MRKLILMILILGVLNIWGLDSVYHNNAEIAAELDSLQQLYPDIMQIRNLGYTATDSLPVLAVKISDNVTVDEDEPAVLYLGQCHAEEIMGVEITMAMINDILLHRNAPPYLYWIDSIEIWFIPTHNPEGLQVVTDEWDTTYRKNKTDTNNNWLFDYVVGVGHDLDGVDLNRNYDFNWTHSDTLNHVGNDNEPYDYYRGAYPFSEPEAQYVKALADEQHFIYSIAWHSSRTGDLSEQIFYPWNWEGVKPSPDLAFHTAFGNTFSHLFEKEDGSGYYEPSATATRNSKAHDWFYNEYGTLQFEVEAGTSNLQPGPELLEDTIERCKPGAYYLLYRVLGYNADAAMLSGLVTDAISGEPLQAEYIIEERNAPSFTPRFSDELFGRYWWQCASTNYTLHVRKKGYQDFVSSVTVSNLIGTTLDVEMQPLPEASITGSISYSGEPVDLIVKVCHEMGDEYFTFPAADQEFNIDWWEGETEVVFTAGGYATQFANLDLVEGVNQYDIQMESEVILFSEDWLGDFSQWDVDGDWYIGIDPVWGIPSAKDTSNRFYENSSESTLEIDGFFNFHGASNLSLEVLHSYHTEHGYDFCYVEVKPDGSDNWEVISSMSGVQDMHMDRFDLSAYENTYSRIRFRLSSDASLNDPGWWLGEMKLVSETTVDEEQNDLLKITSLSSSYPNPFYINDSRSGFCKIDFALATPGEIELSVYNLKGQKVCTLISETMSNGKHSVSWDGRNNNGKQAGSGVYFYQLKTKTKILNRKMILIK